MTARSDIHKQVNHRPFKMGPASWKFVGLGSITLALTLISVVICLPYVYMISTSLKTTEQLGGNPPPIFPISLKTVTVNNTKYTIFNVDNKELARIGVGKNPKGETDRNYSAMFDPANPNLDTPIMVEGRLAGEAIVRQSDKTTYPAVKVWDPHPELYSQTLSSETAIGGQLNFARSMLNTLTIALVGAIGATISAALVAYGFTRFRIPFGQPLFFILLGTIILPPQVTLIPTYIMFDKLGWIPGLAPMIVPYFFSNAYNVFLLRQYFMSMPYELDEAAKVDGATPWQIFRRIILPNSRAALTAVFLFHFLWAYNEFYLSLIYTGNSTDYSPISTRLQNFIQNYSGQPNNLMVGALATMILPLVIFFLAQRTFMQGVVITGVEK